MSGVMVYLVPGSAWSLSVRLLQTSKTAPVGQLSFAGNGRFLASWIDGRVCVWELDSRDIHVGNRKGSIFLKGSAFVLFPSSQSRIIAVDVRGSVRVWETNLWTNRRPIPDPVGSIGCVAAALSPDGERLVRVMRLGPNSDIWRVEYLDVYASRLLWTATQSGGAPVRVYFTPDGQRLRWVSTVIRTLDTTTGEELSQFRSANYHLYAVACSPDCRLLAWPTNFRADYSFVQPNDFRDFALFDADTGAVIQQAICKALWNSPMAFSADSRRLSVAFGEQVRTWDVTTLAEGPTFEPGCGEIMSLAYSPNGMLGAAGSRSGQIAVWDVE